MEFLQPTLLFGLPLIALPIVIHLINRQRHRTIPWGAMIFLLDAKRLTRGMAKLRYWLIMAMRMLAVAGLLFAASRPLASGWVGSAVGSQADTTLILLDRSSSMEQQSPLNRKSKRQTAIEKLVELLQTTASGTRLVLVDSATCQAEELESPLSIGQVPSTLPSDTQADLPTMLQVALDYLVDNEVGQADIWVASDLRRSDWRQDDGRWSTLRQRFAELDGIRFQLLVYPEAAEDNLAVTVQNVRKRKLPDGSELVLDVLVRHAGAEAKPQALQVEFVINGARSALDVELDETDYVLQGHTIPLDQSTDRGWGRVEIPGDANPADNVYFFAFADPPPRQITIVSDDSQVTKPLRIAALASPDPQVDSAATVLPTSRIAEIDWNTTTLLLWQAPLPTGLEADLVKSYLKSGRPAIFFPPETSGSADFLGTSWGAWREPAAAGPHQAASWYADSDLLANTLSGQSLPVGKLQIVRYCQLQGQGTSLARLTTGDRLVMRGDEQSPAYFVATLPQADFSSLATDGVMLYVMIQRAIARGAQQQGDARLVETGSAAAFIDSKWDLLSQLPPEVTSAARPFYAAAYARDGALRAVNRPTSEDEPLIVNDEDLARLFSGLDYYQIKDQLSDASPLANEIWRAFLAMMAIALITEACLCLV